MTKKIALPRGRFALVDDQDFERLSQYKWYYVGKYAARKGCKALGEKNTIYMHREVLQTPDGLETDHVNGDGLDNRRENLRACTASENQRNRSVRVDSWSGFKGVQWSPKKNRWSVRITHNRRRLFVGDYDNLLDAARAYDTAAKDLFGDFRRDNLEVR